MQLQKSQTPLKRLNNKKSKKWLCLLLLLSIFSVRKLHSVHLFQLASSHFPEETEIRLLLQGCSGEIAFITGLCGKPGLQKGKPP